MQFLFMEMSGGTTMVDGRSRIGLLFIFCVGLVFSISPAISPVMSQTLHFEPDPFIPQNYDFTIPLLIEAGGHEVKGVETLITFDPALVTLTSITPGPWYTDSGQDFFFWDYTTPFTYAIHFASAMLDGTNNTDGVIALCHFSFVDFGSSILDFELVDVRDVENNALPFVSDNGLILLGNAVDTQKVSFNSLKAIYR
jgi:hypothetical protein